MNKQKYLILSAAVIAVAITGVLFSLNSTETITVSGGTEQVAEVVTLSGALPDFPVSYLAEETTYAIKGTVIQIKSVPVQYDVAGMPNVFTDVVIAVEKDLKGLYVEDTITVRVDGGQADGYTVVSEIAPEFEVGEEIFIFVGDKENDSIYGDNYYVAGLQHGKYNLDVDGKAKNKDPARDISEDELKELIISVQNNDG